MAQAKKKQSTKTAKKTTARSTAKSASCKRGSASCKKTTCKSSRKQDNMEKFHVYFVTALSMVTAILMAADAAILMQVQ